LSKNIHTIQKVTDIRLVASDKVVLQAKAEKLNYVFKSHYQKAGQTHNTKVANMSFKNISNVKHFGPTLTN